MFGRLLPRGKIIIFFNIFYGCLVRVITRFPKKPTCFMLIGQFVCFYFSYSIGNSAHYIPILSNIYTDTWRLVCFLSCPWHWESSAACSCARFSFSDVQVEKTFRWSPVKAGPPGEHHYLNFHCWSVDGSDSMSIIQQGLLKYTLFTFLHSASSLNPFAICCKCISLDFFFFLFLQVH